jgi:hypothetical protein
MGRCKREVPMIDSAEFSRVPSKQVLTKHDLKERFANFLTEYERIAGFQGKRTPAPFNTMPFETARSAVENRFSGAHASCFEPCWPVLRLAMRRKTFSRTSRVSKLTPFGPRSRSRQPPPTRIFPSWPFPTSNEIQARPKTSSCGSQLVEGSLDTMFIRPSKRSLGLRQFRALGTGPTERSNSRHTTLGSLR